MSARPTTTLHRYAWQAAGQVAGRTASLVSLVVAARVLGLDRYGRFVVLLALLEATMIPWKTTVLQAAAAHRGRAPGGGGWAGTVLRWWLAGAVVLGPAAFWFDGWEGAAALAAASAASAAMFLHVPGLYLAGRQRRYAIGNTAAQTARLAATVALGTLGWLDPRTALLAVGGGALVGAAVLAVGGDPLGGRSLWYGREVVTETLRWAEAHAPILVVALLLGLGSAGGFDLTYKLVQATVLLLGGVGVVMLPAFVRGEEAPKRIIARSLRLPTAAAVLVAAGYAVALGPLLDVLTGSDLGLGPAPAAFAGALVLAPWMGVSWTALVILGGTRWLIPSQVVVSGVAVGASFLAVHGVWWAALAVSAASVLGSVVRWMGVRALGHLPDSGWLAPGAWRRDASWLRGALARRA